MQVIHLVLSLIYIVEDHFNSNVQLRRTARHDVSVAKTIQDSEDHLFHQEERERRHQLARKGESGLTGNGWCEE